MQVAIVDYGAGNLTSVERAVERLGYHGIVTSDPKQVAQSDRIVFPGVGAAGAAMHAIRENGLDEAIQDAVSVGKPVLGICIGIQIFMERSEEDDAECLGLIQGDVRRFPEHPVMKVPQIGWNQVRQVCPHPLFDGIPDGSEFYFVNSYYPVPANEHIVLGRTAYSVEFASIVALGKLVATQFHLEKSGPVGLRMLDNFLRWDV